MAEAPAPRALQVLTTDQREAFAAHGFVHLREAFPREAAVQIQERMWDELREEYGIDRHDRSTWRQPRRCLHRAKWDLGQGVIASESLIGAIHDLLGASDWPLPAHWGVVLTTFPNCAWDEWAVPIAWHSDYGLHGGGNALGDLFIFTFFSSVRPRGGGTLLLSGSHRLLQKFHAELSLAERELGHRELRKRFLRWDPWLRSLAGLTPGPERRDESFMATSREVKGVSVRVVELTGEPGDAVLCHPLILHVRAPNASETPRFMRARNPTRPPR
jgi:hypothetical protein